MAASYVAHQKQAAAHKAFMLDGFKRGVLLMGRQCLAPDTLIRTDRGYKPVADINIGDSVMSNSTENWEYKSVTDTKFYGVDVEPKPMLEYTLYGQKIKTTYDHKFYFGGHYVPIYQLAWREMATGEREKLELLCQQYGQAIDHEAIRLVQNGSHEAWARWQRLSEDGSRREDHKDAPSGSSNLGEEPPKQARSESHRQRQDEQPDRKPGVGDTSGKYSALPPARSSSQQAGRELRNTPTQRGPGTSNQGGQAYEKSYSKGVWGFLVYNPRYSTQANLVSHITVSECSDTYSIEVADNHNYCITEADILVANSGKTYFATQHGWISAVKDQGRYFIVFKTYKQAHEVVWRQYIPLIPPELIFKKNEQDLLIELQYIENTPMKLPDGTEIIINHDKTKPRSTIQLLGSDQSDSHRGFKANGIIFDEYADQDPDNWDAVYKHFFTTTDGWAIFMGTPRGFNHFYDLINYAKENERWYYLEATWRDSPFVKREFIEAERKEAEKQGKLSTFLQEVELEFRAVQGAVYPSFDRNLHIIKPDVIPEDLTVYIGIDFGYHTTACLFIGIDKDQNWYVFDEVYGREEILKDIIPRIRDKLGEKRLVLMVGDSQAKDAIETMARDWPIVPVIKRADSIIHGIDLIRTKLKPRVQLVGEPKPTLFISSVCKNLIQEMEAYKYPEEKPDRNPSELPQKEDDHGPDALRYLMLHLKYGLQREENIPKFEMEKQMNSYGLL